MTAAQPNWISRLDEAAAQCDCEAVCTAVQATLVDEITNGRLQLDPEFLATSAEGYARRLLHRGPNYSVVAMVWGKGQGTPIHDHDGRWCVECVYQGEIRVRNFDLIGSADAEIVQFEEKGEFESTTGMAGYLIPPFEYHTIDNPHAEPAVTIHVYGGEMACCHVFEAVEGGQGYQRVKRELSYTSA